MTDEEKINRNNIQEFNRLPPTGHVFTGKRLTDKACGKLRAYWNMHANINEKKEEAVIEGATASNLDWIEKYQSAEFEMFRYLMINGFIRKAKKLTLKK